MRGIHDRQRKAHRSHRRDPVTDHNETGFKEINELLDAGWHVADVYPMTPLAAGSGRSDAWGMAFAALVKLRHK